MFLILCEQQQTTRNKQQVCVQLQSLFILKVTMIVQRENFKIFFFIYRNKLFSKILQTNKQKFLERREYLPRNCRKGVMGQYLFV